MSFTTQVLFVIIGILTFGRNAFANIRGTPGIDYPTYSSIPRTSFKCSEQDQATGFYADPETRCQVFHYCYENRQETFMCPIGTTFNQAINSCDYWYSSECDTAGVLQITPEKTRNVFNDQPFVPVTRPPHNVFEKIIALRDSNGNLYDQDDETVFQPGDPQDIIPENNRNYDLNGEDQDKSGLSNLEEISEADQQDVNFVPYDLDSANIEDIEIVLSSNKQHDNPNLDFVKEDNSYSQEDVNVSDKPENFEFDTEEILRRIYQKDYSSDNQVKEILDIDPHSLNQDDVSGFGLNSDAVLLKRFSEVESKKRKIRRKPKYVVLQTNFEENPESQKLNPSSETTSSLENTMMTYALDTSIIDSHENAVQIEYDKSKRNRKPLNKDNSYSIVGENPLTDKQDFHGESSEYQSDQTEPENDSNEIENSSVLQSSDSNLDLYEFENANDFNADQENDRSNFLVEDFDSNNFPLNDENFLENQQLSLKEQMETGESHLESDAMNSDEINELLNNSESSYELNEFDSAESDFMEHTAVNLVIGDEFSNSENDATSIESFDSNESSDSYSSTSDVTDSENLNYLGNDIGVSEFGESQNDQTSLYVEDPASIFNDIANDENNVYLESGDVIDLNENRYFEDANIKSENYENSEFRVNSKYLNLTAELERSALNNTGEDYIEDVIPITDSVETNFEDTHTEEEINIDSLEYFESEGQGYFMDENGRIYILSEENEGSGTLIYVGDAESEGHTETDVQDMYVPQTENSPLETTSTMGGSYFSTDSEDPVEDDFDPMEFGKEVEESQDINDFVSGDSEPVSDEDDDQSLAENLIPEKEDNVSDFPETEETPVEHNSTIVLHTLEETGVFHSNLSQVNVPSHHSIDTGVNFFKDEHSFELVGVKNAPNKEKEVIEEPEHKSVEMVQDVDKTKGSQFHISSIPLPANDYEKGLYDERVKYSQQDSNIINSNAFPATFYKQLQAVPLVNKNKPGGSKTVRGSSEGAELLNIKTRLFQNIKSDLASDEVKSAVAEVSFPSKIMNNLFSSFYSPFQSVQGNVDGNFPLQSPKFRNMPGFPKRTGKMFKPAKVFKLINFGKKLLKMKQVKLNSFREYLGS